MAFKKNELTISNSYFVAPTQARPKKKANKNKV